MSSINSGAGITYTFGEPVSLSVTREDRPATPKGLIATTTVQTMDGWVGQIYVARSIVWESDPYETSDEAVDAANDRMILAVKSWFEAPNGNGSGNGDGSVLD